MKWILILIVVGYGSSQTPSVTSVEFNNSASCLKARELLKTEGGDKIRSVIAWCVPKGETKP